MGSIAGLLLLPVMAPVWGFRFVLERLRDEADAVLRDEGRAFAELIELSMRRNTGQLSDADYVEQEAELLERLSSIREHRHELLHAASGEDEVDWSLYAEPDENEDNWPLSDVPDEDEQDWSLSGELQDDDWSSSAEPNEAEEDWSSSIEPDEDEEDQ